MSANIVLRDASDPSNSAAGLDVQWKNTVSSPLASVTALDNGEEVSDRYVLTFTNNAGTISVDVTTDDPKNPYSDTNVSFTDDGVAKNEHVIPGFELVGSQSIDTGHTAVITVGAYMQTDGSSVDRFNVGIIDSGSTSTGFRVAAVNVGSRDAAECSVRALPGFWWTPATAQNVMMEIAPHTDSVREVLAASGEYSITFQNWVDGTGDKAGYKVADVYVDGNLCVTAALFDGSTRYQYGETDYDDANDYLQGLSFVLQNTTDDPTSTTITLTVTDGDQWVEFANDSSGSPGTYGVGPLTITEPGESTGIITISGTAYFWVRYNIPDSASPIDTRRVFKIRTRCKSI